jgi:hypothetical protein
MKTEVMKAVTIDLAEMYKVKKVEQGEENKIITVFHLVATSDQIYIIPINISGIGEAKFEPSGTIRLRVVDTNIWGGFVAPTYVFAVYPSPGYY